MAEVLRDWVVKNAIPELDDHGASDLARRIYGRQDNGYIKKILAGTVREIPFDTVDFFFTKLDRVSLLYEDPYWSELYQSINLRALDITKPTSLKTKRLAKRYVKFVYRELGKSSEKAGKHLSITHGRILTLVDYARKPPKPPVQIIARECLNPECSKSFETRETSKRQYCESKCNRRHRHLITYVPKKMRVAA